MIERKTVTRPIEQIRQMSVDMMLAAGCTQKGAEAAAEVFAEAELRGIGLQGVDYMPVMLKALLSGRIKADAEPKVVKEGPGYILVDGQGGVGQYLGQATVDLAISKASNAGSCAACLYDASELYMLGYYVEQAARAGKIAIACTTSYPLVHPWGGMERIFGTNPIAAAFPTDDEHPVVIDMATSAIANGRLRQAAYYDEKVPMGSGLDAEGYPSKIAKDIQKGAISPLGGAKGFALQLFVALMSGPLVGANIGKALAGTKDGGNSGAKIGHFFLVLDPEHIVGLSKFKTSTSALLDEIRSSDRAPGFDEIRIPGDRAFRQRDINLKEGVPILQATWDILIDLAAEIGVDMPT